MNSSALAAEALDVAHELAKLLDTGLEKEQLSVCIALLETGVNPEVDGLTSGAGAMLGMSPRAGQSCPRFDTALPQALADVVRQLRSQAGASTPPSST